MTDWSATSGPELYRRAKRLIPGGTQLLSKRPEMFLPEHWPAYSSHSRGCEVWDLQGRRLVDMATHGIGSCLLGYADPDVNAAVKAAVDAGSMSLLNSPREVELAERLLEMHPWAENVRYARTGGEIMAVAVRIARAATGRDTVAVCGYHGWSDWYLAANLCEENALGGLLLPGLEPAGVPRGLAGTTRTFHYNRIDELEAVVAECGDDLAAIVMEPYRAQAPEEGFLSRVREIADSCGAVLVFDEITIAFRLARGGAHTLFGVEPDLAAYAKSLSNGFAMAALVGREAVMQAAQTSFISSTYWTEALGPAAAVATLGKMAAMDLPAHLRAVGGRLQAGLRALAERHGLEVGVSGPEALTHLHFPEAGEEPLLRTLFTQEMLERGFLAGAGIYLTASHDEGVIDGYLAACDEVFGVLADALGAGDVRGRLAGPPAHTGFCRLT
jgi:glutamate-1-semialdehyde 2,1-aminomutase